MNTTPKITQTPAPPVHGVDAGVRVSGLLVTKDINLAAFLHSNDPDSFVAFDGGRLPYRFLFNPSVRPLAEKYAAGDDEVSASRLFNSLYKFRRVCAEARRVQGR